MNLQLIEFIREMARQQEQAKAPSSSDLRLLNESLDTVDDMLERYAPPPPAGAEAAHALMAESLTLFKSGLEALFDLIQLGPKLSPERRRQLIVEALTAADEAQDVLALTEQSAEESIFSLDSLDADSK